MVDEGKKEKSALYSFNRISLFFMKDDINKFKENASFRNGPATPVQGPPFFYFRKQRLYSVFYYNSQPTVNLLLTPSSTVSKTDDKFNNNITYKCPARSHETCNLDLTGHLYAPPALDVSFDFPFSYDLNYFFDKHKTNL